MNNSIEVLKNYKDRQVVINQYEDEELVNKDGYFIDYIQIKNNRIELIKNNEPIYSIDLNFFSSFKILEDHHNYFSVSGKNKKLEIYFP